LVGVKFIEFKIRACKLSPSDNPSYVKPKEVTDIDLQDVQLKIEN
jgi:hypothetical protein